MARLDLELNGKAVSAPKEWKGVNVLMTWDNQSAQANITTENFTLVKDAALEVYNWINDGLNDQGNGYFQGIPARFSVSEGSNSKAVFNGFTDNKTFIDKTTNDTNRSLECEISFKQNDQIINFKARAAGVTFDIVRKEGHLTDKMIKDLLFVKQKPFDALEAFAISVNVALLTISLIQAVRDAAKAIADGVAHTTGGITGIAAGAVYTVANALINAIAIFAQLVVLVNQINELLKIFLPMPRKVGVVSLFDLAFAASSYLGYGFKSTQKEMKDWYILPTLTEALDNNPFVASINDKGYFTQSDSGFIVGDYFKNLEEILGGKFQIKDNVANFENLLNDNYWLNENNSSYQMPDVYTVQNVPNGSETKAGIFVEFADDTLDEWTRQNLEGTFATEVITFKNQNDPVQSQLEDLFRISIPYALGNAKETLNAIEKARNGLVLIIDKIGQIFGAKPSKIAEAFANVRQALKISGDFTNKAKLLCLQDANVENKPFKVLKKNHRQELNAKKIIELNSEKSIARNNFRNQWRIYNDVIIPFGFSDFLTVSNNNYFKDPEGNTVRIDSVEWQIGADKARATFRKRIPYDKNVESTIFEGTK